MNARGKPSSSNVTAAEIGETQRPASGRVDLMEMVGGGKVVSSGWHEAAAIETFRLPAQPPGQEVLETRHNFQLTWPQQFLFQG